MKYSEPSYSHYIRRKCSLENAKHMKKLLPYTLNTSIAVTTPANRAHCKSVSIAQKNNNKLINSIALPNKYTAVNEKYGSVLSKHIVLKGTNLPQIGHKHLPSQCLDRAQSTVKRHSLISQEVKCGMDKKRWEHSVIPKQCMEKTEVACVNRINLAEVTRISPYSKFIDTPIAKPVLKLNLNKANKGFINTEMLKKKCFAIRKAPYKAKINNEDFASRILAKHKRSVSEVKKSTTDNQFIKFGLKAPLVFLITSLNKNANTSFNSPYSQNTKNSLNNFLINCKSNSIDAGYLSKTKETTQDICNIDLSKDKIILKSNHTSSI